MRKIPIEYGQLSVIFRVVKLMGRYGQNIRYFPPPPPKENGKKWKLAFILPILRDQFLSNLLFSLYSLLFRERKRPVIK
jgi:hypothetical protein